MPSCSSCLRGDALAYLANQIESASSACSALIVVKALSALRTLPRNASHACGAASHQLRADVFQRQLGRQPRLELDRHVIGLFDLARLESDLIPGKHAFDVGRRELPAVRD